MATLINAHNQWATRRPDERFASITAMHDKALGFQMAGREQDVDVSKLKVAARGGDIVLETKGNDVALTNWSFGQLCTVGEAPAGYLSELPAHIAADALNFGLRQSHGDAEDGKAKRLMFRKDEHSGMHTLRALTSPRYSRIWNSDITRRLLELEAGGTWQPAPAAFDGSRGLYLSDRDMFAFLVDNNRRIFETGPDGGLSRGFFVQNSEVGASAFKLITFFYEYVCGNHRVWGATDITEIAIRHIGNANEKVWDSYEATLKVYAESSAEADEARVEAMRTIKLGDDMEAVLDAVFKRRIPELSRKTLEAGYKRAEEFVDWYGDPRTVWGLTGGLTQVARDLPIATDRVALERASAKLMDMVTV